VSRIIKTETVGKQRIQLSKAVFLSVRELAKQADTGPEAHDLAAFISEALRIISEGIDESVSAWEKRGYWVKADRFRMEWSWAGEISKKMKTAVLTNDWTKVAEYSAIIAQKLPKIKISTRHRSGTPWVGAFELIRTRKD
jgi:hypothetical protein